MCQYGRTFERTRFDKNEIIIKGNYAEVVLYNNKSVKVAIAHIDLCDINLISKYKWGYDSLHNYATTRINGEFTLMHQLIMKTKELGKNTLVDHKDRNGLNNRRDNLRVANKSINAININIKSNNSSGVTGVSYSDSKKLWRSYINYNKKRIDLGWFKSKDEAVIARLKAELKYYPDHPPQQNLIEKYNIEKDDI